MLHAFNTEFGTATPSVAEFEERLTLLLARTSVVAFIAGEENDPVGFALATSRPSPYFDGPLTVLDEMYVRPADRGRGWGSRLMGALLHHLHELDCGEVHINVDEMDRDARRFYERHGFTNQDPASDERMLLYVQEL